MMKFVTCFAITALIAACSGSFSKGIKKDLSTGLTTSYSGLAIEDAYLTDAGSNRLSDHTIVLGSKLAVVATGVDLFKEKEGRVFPGCTILLTDKSGKEILNIPDAFAEMTTGTAVADAKVLQATLNTGAPMQAGETYHLKTRFFDKQNPASEIVSEVDLTMKQ